MIAEDQVIRFFDQANPVPDVESLDVDSIGAARHLTTLNRRSSEMVQIETRDSEASRKQKRPTWLIAAAAAVLVVALGVLLVLVNDEPEVVATDPETTIDQFLAATDYESLAATMTPEGIAGFRGVWGYTLDQEGIADELAAREILGFEYLVESCEEAGESVIRCQISYRDSLSEALSEEPIVTPTTFNMVDGLISVYPNLHSRDLFTIGAFADDAGLRQEFTDLCPPSGALQPECATFIMDNLDGLAGSGETVEASAVYDGEGCTYDGPTEVSTGTRVRYTFTNNSDSTDVTFGIFRLPEGTTQQDIFDTGIDPISGGDTILILHAPSPLGAPRADSTTFEDPGLYGAACTDFSGGENDGQGLSHVTMIQVSG